MGNKTDQHTVGRPDRLRGQQTGFAGTPDQNRKRKAATPAVRGRKDATKMFGDNSAQHIAGDSVTPSTNAPSTPAMNTGGTPGKSGGERIFKRRLKKMRTEKGKKGG